MKNSKKISTISILITLCLGLAYIEVLIPFNFIIPGIKLGLSNIVILFALYKLDAKSAITINLMRIFIISVLFTNGFALIYSISGGILSFIAMYITKKVKFLSIISVSVMGSLFHNIGQIITAIFILNNMAIINYLPILLIVGVFTGIIIGYITAILLERLNKI